MIRRSLLPAAALVGLLAALPGPTAAAQTTLVPGSVHTTPAAPDYATEVLGDAWDYSQPADAQLDGAATRGLEAAYVRDGRLSFATKKQGHVSLLWGGYPGGLYLGREGSAPQNRIDAGRYTRISMQLWSSRETPAALTWSGCEGLQPQCEGGMPLALKAGWHTYDLPLVNRAFGLPQDWTGEMQGLRLLVNPGAAASYELDWARVYAPAPGATFASLSALTWDVDDDPTDDTGERSGWGRLPCPQGLCDLSVLPPGSYHLRPAGSQDAGTPVVLRRPARPVLLDPDVVGGPEYSAADPWDYDVPGDVGLVGNAVALGFGDRMSGVNAGPAQNDPYVFFNLRGGLIDPQRYHRLTVRSSYEGPFGLEDAPGGGSHARVIWYPADTGGMVPIESKEWVTYSGSSLQTYDLKDRDIHEDDIPAERKRPWAAAPILSLRWDPNEDPGQRRWTLDRVALRADDEAGSSFRIRWYDDGYAPGSTISLFRDDDDAGFDGVPIAVGLEQQPGANGYTWDVGDVAEGRWWVYAVVEGPAGVGRSYSTGPVLVDRAVRGQGASPAAPVARDLSSACPDGRVPDDGLGDVPVSVHEPAVDCAVWWGVARGTAPGRFSPDAAVNRGQMALFVARLLTASGASLPADPPDAFADDEGATPEQQRAIDQLASVGVVGGVAPGQFAPAAPVSRDQMATFLVRAYELRTRTTLSGAADHFRDDGASVHAARIDAAATLGIATGVADERYAPFGSVSRVQMGSFLARLLDVLVAAGSTTPPVR